MPTKLMSSGISQNAEEARSQLDHARVGRHAEARATERSPMPVKTASQGISLVTL